MSDRREYTVVHVTGDGTGELTMTSTMTLPEAIDFYDRVTGRQIGQGGACICHVLHDAGSQFPAEDLLLPPKTGDTE